MTSIRVLIGGADPQSSADLRLSQRLQAVDARIEVVTTAQVESNPQLLNEVEIIYGHLSHELLARAARLRWWQTQGAGMDSLLTPEVRERDIVLTNVSGIHAAPIAEHMFGLLLMLTRRLGEARDQQKTRQWRGYDFFGNVDMIAGKTLGVLGVGAIGGHSARVGQAFGMRVLGLRRGGAPHPHVERMYRPAERLDFLRECDVVMNSLPLTNATRGFLGREEFAAMKPGAVVINTGRGATIDTEAMTEALREKRLGAALLDVTEPEPLPEDHPLWTMENVVITPHYSGAHPTYGERADAIFLDNLRRYAAGEPLTHVVDKSEGY